MRLLQLQLGEGAHQPQRHRALLWRERQAAALLRHVEERLRCRGGRQARLLAGRRQLLRQVRGKRKVTPDKGTRASPNQSLATGLFHQVLFLYVSQCAFKNRVINAT